MKCFIRMYDALSFEKVISVRVVELIRPRRGQGVLPRVERSQGETCDAEPVDNSTKRYSRPGRGEGIERV